MKYTDITGEIKVSGTYTIVEPGKRPCKYTLSCTLNPDKCTPEEGRNLIRNWVQKLESRLFKIQQ